MPSVDYIEKPSHGKTDDLWTRHAESAGIHVSKRSGGNFHADFALRLVRVGGSTAHKEDDIFDAVRPQSDAALQSLLGCLRPGQEVNFQYRWQSRGGQEPVFEMLVTGQSTATDAVHAGERALALRRDVQTSLQVSRVGHFEFAVVEGGPAQEGATSRHFEIARPGVIVPCGVSQEIGFLSPSTVNESVVLALPQPPDGRALDAFMRPEIAQNADLRMCVRVRPRCLSQEEIVRLEAACKTVAAGGGGHIRLENFQDGRIIDEAHLGALGMELQRWIREPRGYQVSCFVDSTGPVERSALDMIGRALFLGEAAVCREANEARPDVAGSDPQQLRLNECLHSSAAPVNLLPSVESLIACGVARNYRHAPAGVARDGMKLGSCGHGGRERDVRLTESNRDRHCYIIGATGTGKSTLLYNMVREDIHSGAGVCLIDPHGDLHEDVLRAVPEHRAKDVVLIDLADFDYSVALNFLECSGEHKDIQTNFIVNEMLTIFGQLYNMKIAGGPMFESYMRNALLTLMSDDDRVATLLDVVRFFEDRSFRSRSIERSSNAIAASFWSRTAERAGGEASLKNVAPYITSKLNQFTHNALLRPIIGQAKSTVNFREAMDEGRIVLVNLAKGLLGEFDTRLLGMLVIGKLFNAALGRATLPAQQRRRFNLYIDEFQALVTPTVIGLLSEARKFGLSLTLANQHLAQISQGEGSSSVADAVLGNVATLLFFRLGPKDAKSLEAFTEPVLSAQDLQRLPDHHAACRMVSGNSPQPPFVFRVQRQDRSRLDEGERIAQSIRIRARSTYLKRREFIEQDIMRGWLR